MSSEKTPLLSSDKSVQLSDENSSIVDGYGKHNIDSFDSNEESASTVTTWPSNHYNGYQTHDYSGGTVKQNPKYAENNTYNNNYGISTIVTNYDQILVHIGDIGWWQIMIVGLLCFPSIAGGILVLLTNFTALEPESFRCAISECDGPMAIYSDLELDEESMKNNCLKPVISRLKYDLISNISNFLSPDQRQSFDNCSEITRLDIIETESCDATDASQNILYQPFQYETTIVTEFNLVCDEQYKVALCGTFYMIGLWFGALLGSKPSDYFGRKPLLFFFLILGGLANIAGGLVSNYWLYVFFRTLAGIASQGLTTVSFTLSIEVVGVKYQGIMGCVNEGFFAIGTCIVGLLAYLIRDWRNLHFASSALILPQILFFWFVIPESPRWLVTQKRWKPLRKMMSTCERMNGKRIPSCLIIPSENEKMVNNRKFDHQFESSNKSPNTTLTQDNIMYHEAKINETQSSKVNMESRKMPWSTMFKNKFLLSRTCIMMVNWGMISLVYYGAGLSSTTLGGDIFLNFTLVAFMEVLGNIGAAFIINHWGRKTTLVMGFILAAIGCFGVGFVPSSEKNIFLFLLLLGKFGGAFAFTSMYIFTAELFPTPIRNTALGTCSMACRLIAVSAPYIALYLPNVTSQQAPFFIFGAAGLIGTILSIFLPESLGHPLPDTLEEAAEMNEGGKSFFSCWSSDDLKYHVNRRRLERTANL